MGAYDGVREYYLDYSTRELEPWEFVGVDGVNSGFGYFDAAGAIRYAGYPGNRKCISHYPDMYRRLVDAGKKIALVHEIGYNDFLGGRDAGRQHAETLKADARSIGYPDTGYPYFFAFDRQLPGNPAGGAIPTTLDVVYDYINGCKDVVGYDDCGLYGFWDVIHPAIADNLTRWRWLCGSASRYIDGVSVWQFNNGYVYPGSPPVSADVNLVYVDMFGSGSTEDFLMGLPQWQQDRVYDRILSMSAGVAGQNFDGPQFGAEESWRREVGQTLNAQSAVLAQIAANSGATITLSPEQLAKLTTDLDQRVSTEINDMESKLVARLDTMAAALATKLGADKVVVLSALKEFYGVAVRP